jgi:hypothetical protein
VIVSVAPRIAVAVAVAVACTLMALTACGPGEEDDPKGAATAVWDRFRGNVHRLTTATGRQREEPRRLVCYRLYPRLRQSLAERVGARDQPQCPFLDRVALLNGTRRLGPLQDLRVPDQRGPLTVRARITVGDRVRDVELQEVNPANWQITRLAGLP